VFLPLFLLEKAPKRGAFLSEGCHFKGVPQTFGGQLPQTGPAGSATVL